MPYWRTQLTRFCLPALLTLAALAPGVPAAWGQTVLNTAHNGSAHNGYVAAASGNPYTVKMGATFDNNHNAGLSAIGGANVTVNDGDFSGNKQDGLIVINSSAVVDGGTFTGNGGNGLDGVNASTLTINGGTFSGNTFGGIAVDGGNASAAVLDISGGTFTGDQYGLIVDSGVANVAGGTFGGDVYDIVGSGSTITLDGQWLGGPMTFSASGGSNTPLTGSFVGVLADGGGKQTFTYELVNSGTIILAGSALAVPKSSSFALLALGLLPVGLAFSARQQKQFA